MFNTAKDDDELRQPGHIQNARLFDTDETKNNIRELVVKSRSGLNLLNAEEEKKAESKRNDGKRTANKANYMQKVNNHDLSI